MDGKIFELGVGRIAVPAAEVRSGQLRTIGLCDEHQVLQCLGDVPVGIAAFLTATWPPEPKASRTEARIEHLGTGTVIATRVGGCVNFVGLQVADDETTGGLNREALSRLRGRRVRLDVHLIVTACGCSSSRETEPETPEAGRP